MLYVLSEFYQPYFNLATEEYLLKNKTENIFMLWRAETSVVVGKHQNALAELNYKYIRENNIDIARRLSGGGTVVHDMQNLNFTFISNGEDGKLIDFKRFVSPIIDYLATLGIEAHIGTTNEIRIGDLKISGNAEHVFKKRVLHHGTLLFNSNLNRLRDAIKSVPGKYFDKAVQSNRASVTNIIDHLSKKISIEEFTQGLINFIADEKQFDLYRFSENEKIEISKLVTEKYNTTEWIWGYSPKYVFKNSFEFQANEWQIELRVEKGIIKESKVVLSGTNIIEPNSLVGTRHIYPEISEKLKSVSILETISNNDFEQLCNAFF